MKVEVEAWDAFDEFNFKQSGLNVISGQSHFGSF